MIERLTRPVDVNEIEAIMREKDVWENVTDDGSNTLNLSHLTAIIGIHSFYFLVPVIQGVRVGAFFLHPHNYVTYELHSMVKKENRGRLVREGLMEVGEFMFNSTPCQKIITLVPAGNYRAKFMARFMGMEYEGVNRKSLLRNGKLIDQHMYGACKCDFDAIKNKVKGRKKLCQRHQ